VGRVAPSTTVSTVSSASIEEATWPSGAVAPDAPAEKELVEQNLLVEDVSIDGMCGVY
jgi:mycofactocin precursor